MPKIDIDKLVEPIEIVVGGKTYTVEDISQETADKMGKAAADAIDEEGKPKKEDSKLVLGILKEILGADAADLTKLGMRKRSMLITRLMGTINEELEGKNVPKVAVQK